MFEQRLCNTILFLIFFYLIPTCVKETTVNLTDLAKPPEPPAPPADRWHLVYIIMLLHGLGTLTAWNTFITATEYFKGYKLGSSLEYSSNYLTSVGWASQIPNLLFSWFNVFVQVKGNLTTRIISSLAAEMALFMFTLTLAMIDTSAYVGVFFWLTMVTAFLLNVFNAIFQNCVYGVAGFLPPKYTGAVVLGSNVCGTLIVFLSMTTKLAKSIRRAAIYYFIGGIFVMLVCLDTYYALPINRFFRYYESLHRRGRSRGDGADQTQAAAKVPHCKIMRQAAMQLYNVFVTFFVSLAVFPAVQESIRPSKENFLGVDLGTFKLICVFLTFNLTALIGNITASCVQFPRPRWLVFFTTVRFLFIPFFLFCNYQVEGKKRTVPVYISNDWAYWGGAALLGWSSGHGSSLGMMYVCGTVAPEHASTAGMIGGATLVTGIVTGITFSRVCPLIVT